MYGVQQNMFLVCAIKKGQSKPALFVSISWQVPQAELPVRGCR